MFGKYQVTAVTWFLHQGLQLIWTFNQLSRKFLVLLKAVPLSMCRCDKLNWHEIVKISFIAAISDVIFTIIISEIILLQASFWYFENRMFLRNKWIKINLHKHSFSYQLTVGRGLIITWWTWWGIYKHLLTPFRWPFMTVSSWMDPDNPSNPGQQVGRSGWSTG